MASSHKLYNRSVTPMAIIAWEVP